MVEHAFEKKQNGHNFMLLETRFNKLGEIVKLLNN